LADTRRRRVAKIDRSYVKFVEAAGFRGRKTKRYEVVSAAHGFTLGVVNWFDAWRRYAFSPSPDTVYSAGCLREIAAFVDGLTGKGRNHER
jgi:hypothetical protein